MFLPPLRPLPTVARVLARRVEWKCDSMNTRSRKMALRLGFRFEGIFRNHMIIKGHSRDTAWFGVTAEDWVGWVRKELLDSLPAPASWYSE